MIQSEVPTKTKQNKQTKTPVAPMSRNSLPLPLFISHIPSWIMFYNNQSFHNMQGNVFLKPPASLLLVVMIVGRGFELFPLPGFKANHLGDFWIPPEIESDF